MTTEKWTITRPRFDIDDRARGRAVYRVDTGTRVFELMVLSQMPSDRGRTPRIIGRNWDMMGALIEGTADEAGFDLLDREIPKLYVGRALPETLVWCRSNRSGRVFDITVEALAAGRQPDPRDVTSIGYLMRNTGLDGNGTFGTRSQNSLPDGHPLQAPLHAQMLAAYLMREFSFDLVDHLAQVAGGTTATKLAPMVRRSLGLGNGSGLGLLYFVNTHPLLIQTWLHNRQDAILRASRRQLGHEEHAVSLELVSRAGRYYANSPVGQTGLGSDLDIARDLELVRKRLESLAPRSTRWRYADFLETLWGQVGGEAWEVAAALALDLCPDEARRAVTAGNIVERTRRDAAMTVGHLLDIVRHDYAWALKTDLRRPGAKAFVWYKSRNNEEPRRGPASEVPLGRQWALDLPGEVQELHSALRSMPRSSPAAHLLWRHPHLRATVERIQTLEGLRLHSPHMNMLADDFRPLRIIRFMNSTFHGLEFPRDYYDRVVYGRLFAGAPTRDELGHMEPHRIPSWRFADPVLSEEGVER